MYSRSPIWLGVFTALAVGAAFGLPLVSGRSIQAQAVAAPLVQPAKGGAATRHWREFPGPPAVAALQAASGARGPVAREAAPAIFDLDPWAEQWALRRELLARNTYAARQARAALAAFVSKLPSGGAETITGVFVAGELAYPVDQQPVGNAAFVSDAADRLTQFNLASRFGTVGFLAHNDLAGASFFNLALGQKVQVVFGDGSIRSYLITETHSFQAKEPYSPYSDFLDLGQDSRVWSAEDLFFEMYAGDERVVFQTCIAAEGVSTWGRYFVIAIPTP